MPDRELAPLQLQWLTLSSPKPCGTLSCPNLPLCPLAVNVDELPRNPSILALWASRIPS